MTPRDVSAVMESALARDMMASDTPARLGYTGLDGAPRVVPVAFLWNGVDIVVTALPESAKVKALAVDPRVAITIDTTGSPPRALLVRGLATMTSVRGVPDEFVEASRKIVPSADFPEWERGVRAIFAEMVVVTVAPRWARLLDFENTFPRAVERAAVRYDELPVPRPDLATSWS